MLGRVASLEKAFREQHEKLTTEVAQMIDGMRNSLRITVADVLTRLRNESERREVSIQELGGSINLAIERELSSIRKNVSALGNELEDVRTGFNERCDAEQGQVKGSLEGIKQEDRLYRTEANIAMDGMSQRVKQCETMLKHELLSLQVRCDRIDNTVKAKSEAVKADVQRNIHQLNRWIAGSLPAEVTEAKLHSLESSMVSMEQTRSEEMVSLRRTVHSLVRRVDEMTSVAMAASASPATPRFFDSPSPAVTPVASRASSAASRRPISSQSLRSAPLRGLRSPGFARPLPAASLVSSTINSGNKSPKSSPAASPSTALLHEMLEERDRKDKERNSALSELEATTVGPRKKKKRKQQPHPRSADPRHPAAAAEAEDAHLKPNDPAAAAHSSSLPSTPHVRFSNKGDSPTPTASSPLQELVPDALHEQQHDASALSSSGRSGSRISAAKRPSTAPAADAQQHQQRPHYVLDGQSSKSHGTVSQHRRRKGPLSVVGSHAGPAAAGPASPRAPAILRRPRTPSGKVLLGSAVRTGANGAISRARGTVPSPVVDREALTPNVHKVSFSSPSSDQQPP